MSKQKIYKSLYEYFITVKTGGKYYRLIKIEQGQDSSLYVKWNIGLAKSKDGIYHRRSYISYHSTYDEKNDGYRIHNHGCSGDRIPESIYYSKLFISERTSAFFKMSFNGVSKDEGTDTVKGSDVTFEIEHLNDYEIILISSKHRYLIGVHAFQPLIRELQFKKYSLFVCCFHKEISRIL